MHERFALKGRDGLAAKVRELGLAIPYREDVGPLFRPVIVPGGRRLENRLVVHPMEGADAGSDGSPGELTFRRYRRSAAGGCGLVWFEATAVETEGRSNPHQLMLTEGTLGSFKRLVEAARETAAETGSEGASSPAFILQLTHSGRFSKPGGVPRPQIAQHNPFLDPLRGTRPGDPLVPDLEIDRLKNLFVEASGLAAEAGFDGVDIKACHGYLVGELLAARTREGSRYGGPLENRARFLLDTISAVRSQFPGLIAACRLGVFDAVPFPYGFGAAESAPAAGAPDHVRGSTSAVISREYESRMSAPGYAWGSSPPHSPALISPAGVADDLSEPITLIERMIQSGLALLNVTIGIPAHRAHIGRPFDRPAAGGTLPAEHPLEGIARLLRIAGTIQKAFPALPVVGTGYSWLRGLMPHVAAGVVDEGMASLIGLGRMSFAYPDFARDLGKLGTLERKKLCVACSGCTELLRAGGPAGCIIRDRSVYKTK